MKEVEQVDVPSEQHDEEDDQEEDGQGPCGARTERLQLLPLVRKDEDVESEPDDGEKHEEDENRREHVVPEGHGQSAARPAARAERAPARSDGDDREQREDHEAEEDEATPAHSAESSMSQRSAAANDLGLRPVPIVESLRLRLLLVGPLRLGLSVVWLVAAQTAGAQAGSTLLAFAAGAFVTVFLVPNDPRARLRRAPAEPQPLPAAARVAPAWLHAFHAALPSTVGVSALAAVTLAFRPALTALLGGILAGLGAAALLRVRGVDERLYVEHRQRVLFRR